MAELLDTAVKAISFPFSNLFGMATADPKGTEQVGMNRSTTQTLQKENVDTNGLLQYLLHAYSDKKQPTLISRRLSFVLSHPLASSKSFQGKLKFQ